MEALQYNLLFRWCVGLDLDAPVWDVTVFTKNRDRLLEGAVATAFFEQVLAQAKTHRLLSDEHFTVDGTLIEAWAGQKSFKQKRVAAPVTVTVGGLAATDPARVLGVAEPDALEIDAALDLTGIDRVRAVDDVGLGVEQVEDLVERRHPLLIGGVELADLLDRVEEGL